MALRKSMHALCATLALLAVTLAHVPPGLASEGVLQPFVATYTVEWRGMSAGRSTLELRQVGPDTFLYRSRNLARGLFRIAFPDAVTQTSTFTVKNGTVVPLSYTLDDGSQDTRRDVRLQFDWSTGRVTGIAENAPVDEELEPGTQDPMSVQIALMRELAAGRSPTSFALIDKDEIKEYEYTREATETLDTPLGSLETIIYRSQRQGSSRVTRLWLAPSLDFVPIRAERRRAQRIDFILNIREINRRTHP